MSTLLDVLFSGAKALVFFPDQQALQQPLYHYTNGTDHLDQILIKSY